jgi:hypothetical protein
MAPLTSDRNTPRAERGFIKSIGVAAGALIFAGGIVCRNAAGLAVRGSATVGLRAVGRANEHVDNTAGGAGDLKIKVEEGVFRFANAGADPIAVADIGNRCFIADDQTVAKTSGAGTRPPAGRIVDIDAQGVLVLMGDDVLASRKIYVPVRIATLVAGGAYYAPAPAAGRVTNLMSIIEGVLTTGDATLQAKINGVNITTGLLTVTQAGSAVGDVDTATPTAANVVAAGDKLSITVGGANATASTANLLFEIEID